MAILWHELWHEGLEEASRLYFGERNIKGMLATLEPLHKMMDAGPQTLKETAFNQVIAHDCTLITFLKEAFKKLLYKCLGNWAQKEFLLWFHFVKLFA